MYDLSTYYVRFIIYMKTSQLSTIKIRFINAKSLTIDTLKIGSLFVTEHVNTFFMVYRKMKIGKKRYTRPYTNNIIYIWYEWLWIRISLLVKNGGLIFFTKKWIKNSEPIHKKGNLFRAYEQACAITSIFYSWFSRGKIGVLCGWFANYYCLWFFTRSACNIIR